MRLEMEGKEPLIFLFGVPVITATIVLVSFYYGKQQAQGQATPNINRPQKLDANLILPEGSIQIVNKISPIPKGAEISGATPLQVTPEIKATLELPEGAIQVTNNIIVPEPKHSQVRQPNKAPEIVENENIRTTLPKSEPIEVDAKVVQAKTNPVIEVKKGIVPKVVKDKPAVKKKPTTPLKTNPQTQLKPKPKPKPLTTPTPVSAEQEKQKSFPNIPGPEGEVLPPPRGVQVPKEKNAK